MKIMICGSMAFAKNILKVKKELEKLGHQVNVPVDIENHLADSSFTDKLDENHQHCVANNILKKCFDLIAESDAILFLNLKKNNIDGYIGASGLMEIGLAHYLGKKIFLFNKIPSYHEQRWALEVSIMQPIIIDQELSKIR